MTNGLNLQVNIDDDSFTQPAGIEIACEGIVNLRNVSTALRELSDGNTDLRATPLGRLFRAGQLSELTLDGAQNLRELGITDVIDMRSDYEIERDGIDKTYEMLNLHNIPVVADIDDAVRRDVIASATSRLDRLGRIPTFSFDRSLEDGQDFANVEGQSVDKLEFFKFGYSEMIKIYEDFILSETARAGIGKVINTSLQVLAKGGSPLLHCRNGKDRTGWTIWLLEQLFGADEKTAMEEYKLSHSYAHHFAREFSDFYKNNDYRLLIPYAGVYREYLRRAIALMNEEFGDMRTYLKACQVDLSLVSAALTGSTSSTNARVNIIAGPSGVGKGTLTRALIEKHPEVFLSISNTTRAPRSGEIDGVHYNFSTRSEFEAGIEAGAFLEHALVHKTDYYGTPIAPVQTAVAAGRPVILEIDVQGVWQVVARAKELGLDVQTIFVKPPTIDALKERLGTRGTENAEQIDRRLTTAIKELEEIDRFDHTLINDDLDLAFKTLESLVL